MFFSFIHLIEQDRILFFFVAELNIIVQITPMGAETKVYVPSSPVFWKGHEAGSWTGGKGSTEPQALSMECTGLK